MLQAYALNEQKLILTALAEKALWLDLCAPTQEEERAVEALASIEIPTREEMREIEPSSRLYVENGVLYLTASILCNTQNNAPKLAVISFILTPKQLITLRYDTPKSFELFVARMSKDKAMESHSPAHLLALLLDTIIDRAADILEQASEEIDKASSVIFSQSTLPKNAFSKVMHTVGTKGDLVSKIRESLYSLSRLLLFVMAEHEILPLEKSSKSLLKTQQIDCDYLKQHCDALESKIGFLMDATLGLVSMQQNNIIKIFSVVSVIFMPPTMIASIYGMNFKIMPELEWSYGYPYALGLMLFSAILPFVLFKWKKWL
jgi:magnesium transporter